MTARVKVYGLLVIVAVAAGISVWKTKPSWLPGMPSANAATPDQGKDQAKEATPVELATAKVGEISSFISATANLRALREVAIATQAEGIVKEVLAEEGD